MTPELVAVQLPPGETFVAVLEQAWARGDAVLPLPHRAGPQVVQRIVERLRPAAIVRRGGAGRVRAERLPHGTPVTRGTALVMATSGTTTGTPKGVELSHTALRASTRASLERLGAERGARWLGCLPLHHVAGLQTILRSRAGGGEPVLLDGFDVDAVRSSRADHVSLVPTQLHRLLDAEVDLARFESILLGGGPASASLLRRAAEAGARVVVSYGMTETCGGCVYDGVPLDGVETSVAADGRILLRGPVLMRGYRGDPDATAAALHNGWLRTSDLGWVDEDGRLHVLGRADDVIVTGGENVPAGPVAAILAGHPKVAEAAVVGRPDEEWGEVVTAVVVPVDPDAPPSLEELRERAREELPVAALPRALVVVGALPRDGLGKISRPTLAALARR